MFGTELKPMDSEKPWTLTEEKPVEIATMKPLDTEIVERFPSKEELGSEVIF